MTSPRRSGLRRFRRSPDSRGPEHRAAPRPLLRGRSLQAPRSLAWSCRAPSGRSSRSAPSPRSTGGATVAWSWVCEALGDLEIIDGTIAAGRFLRTSVGSVTDDGEVQARPSAPEEPEMPRSAAGRRPGPRPRRRRVSHDRARQRIASSRWGSTTLGKARVVLPRHRASWSGCVPAGRPNGSKPSPPAGGGEPRRTERDRFPGNRFERQRRYIWRKTLGGADLFRPTPIPCLPLRGSGSVSMKPPDCRRHSLA